ncbi:MAG: glycosyltransferase family 4 protein [Gemmatimonadaceae bacterium]|nr:glycosyltransferase family 4 protein [Gemmatimonadaceae bacterium]
MSHPVLLTVSGVIAPTVVEDAAAGRRPRADYIELARICQADLIDYAIARRESGAVGRLLERVGGPNLVLAWACFRRRGTYRAILTDGEQIGLLLAGMLKARGGPRPRHLMITHIISVAKKMVFLDWLRVQSHVDRFLVYATWQQRFIEQRWHLPTRRVPLVPFMVDAQFFAPGVVPAQPAARAMICAVGLERRDYPTLLTAVDGLEASVMIAAASPWAKQRDTTEGQVIPGNVTVQRFSQFELRQLYADSRFLVMPLYDVEFQAGVTAILEAMAMGKAVICSRTAGQTDVIVDGETGIYVPPGDPAALRAAIQHLLDHPDEAERMGRAGRRVIEERMQLDVYSALIDSRHPGRAGERVTWCVPAHVAADARRGADIRA